MSLISVLHPRNFLAVLREIDADAEAGRVSAGTGDHRPAIMLLTVAVSLLLIHYLKFASAFQSFTGWYAYHFTADPTGWLLELRHGRFIELLTHAWWGFWHIVGYVLIPVLTIRFIFRERIRDYHLGLGELHRHVKWYLLLISPILVFVVLVSFRDDFSTHYPFYSLAGRSWLDLLLWESIYLIQFVCLEFFFRGFMLHSARTAFGSNAVFVMCVPYLMIHFAKPWLEASGAILFGLFLGVLALRSRSIWGGVAVHAGVALSMDIAALLQVGGLPRVWLPG